MMVRNADLNAERLVLENAFVLHQGRVNALVEKMEAAEAAFSSVFGFHPWEAPEYAPQWTTLKAELEALNEEAFWPLSRLHDLELIVGKYEGTQLMFHSEPRYSGRNVWKLGGDVPAAKPEVWAWLAKTMGS